ncbi:MAG: transposase [Pseudomonadota bacterium]
MSDYRRVKEPYKTFFFTVVTYNRQQILCEPESRIMLREALEKVRALYPFRIDAWVLLPEHLHCIWTMPENDYDFSKRWGMVKKEFTARYQTIKDKQIKIVKGADSRNKRRESFIWQRRFWEHAIRDQNDFNHHCDYIHYNPVKHSLVEEPREWPYSTVNRFVKAGLYSPDWATHLSMKVKGMELE